MTRGPAYSWNGSGRIFSSSCSMPWIVSRTWSARLKTTSGSSAWSARSRGLDRLAELDQPLARQRHQPERAEPRERRRDREVRQAEQPGQRLDVGQHRVDLLGADDRHRDDRGAGAQRRRHEAAAAEALQLVPVGVALADALEALGEDADQLAVAHQPLGVGVAGQGGAGLAGQLGQHRHPEHQVGAEQPQVAVRPGARRARRRQSISASSATVPEWLPTTSAGALVRQVLDAEDLGAEPVAVEQAQHGMEDRVGQLGVEAELVDLVLRRSAGGAGRPAPTRRPARPTCVVVADARRPDSSSGAPAPTWLMRLRGSGLLDAVADAARRRRSGAPACCGPDEVVERLRGGARREAELLDQPGGVDHPAVHEQVELVEAEPPTPTLRASAATADRPGSSTGSGDPAGPADRLGQREHARRRPR